MSGPTAIAEQRRRKRLRPPRPRPTPREPMNVLIVGVGGQGVIMVSKALACWRSRRASRSSRAKCTAWPSAAAPCSATCASARRCGRPPSRRAKPTSWSRSNGPKACAGCPISSPTPAFSSATPSASCRRSPASTGAPARRCATRARRRPKSSAHVAEGYAIDATDMAEETRQRARRQRGPARRPVDGARLSAADWEKDVTEFVPKKTIAVNLEAFRLGRGWIDEARTTTPPVPKRR